MKKLIINLGLGLSALGFFLCIATFSQISDPIEFESLESKTETGLPIYNRIQFLPGWKKDVWIMQQYAVKSTDVSPTGATQPLHPPEHQTWDKLAIVVDKSQPSTTATFYQLAPGELEFTSATKKLPLKVRCYACHVNGPRAIRPLLESSAFAQSPWKQVQTTIVNLRIKTYGPIESRSGSPEGGSPFHSPLKVMGRNLNLNSCNGCHSQNGMRSELKFEHLGTIDFMVSTKRMPPWPYQISDEDNEQLKKIRSPYSK